MFSLFTNFFSEAVIFALYVFVCIILVKPRFSVGVRVAVYAAAVLFSCVITAALTLAGKEMTALTLLPLSAYLPFSICVYVLSESGLPETVEACSIAALSALCVKVFKKTVLSLFFSRIQRTTELVSGLAVLLFAAATGYVVYRYLRGAFAVCARLETKKRSLVLIPLVTLLLMIFINLNSASTRAFSLMTLVIAVSFLITVSWLFVYWARLAEADKKERQLSESLELQRRNFERLSQSVDAGRIYRHDMRHHLKVLRGMAQQNNSVEILEYIGELDKNNELSAPEMFCKNPAVNAVLSEHISRAEKLGCRMTRRISIPEELPYENTDVCIILSNALENALNACAALPQDKRYLHIIAETDESRLKISVNNSCADNVVIDSDGLPEVRAHGDGHGIGLRGVKKTVEKYNGFICCACRDGEFRLCAEIFKTPCESTKTADVSERGKHSKALTAVVSVIICTVGLLNFSPATAAALSDALSVNIKTISLGWGDNSFLMEYPELTGINSGKFNQAANEFINEAWNVFRQYVNQKYEGYVAEDISYRIYANKTDYLSVRFYATINAGGSADFCRCVTLDTKTGEVISLADLFDEERDYIAEISAEVLRQMELRTKFNGSQYFIPGGIWGDEECFREISPEQEFYLDSAGNLVIVFDEYTVAPGSEGMPEFLMPDEIFRFVTHE